ncbi:mercury resistance system periplasmic binding protein MerP [Marinobacteraceae bacterium S3BR75-40.1]
MKRRFTLAFLSVLLSMPALAAMQTVTLSVPGMTCAACPITVKVALNKVDGVSQVHVSYPDREAVVVFDDTITAVEALTQATENAGYPSTPKSSKADRDQP